MDNHTSTENLPSELYPPPVKDIFTTEFLAPIFVYYVIFHLLGRFIGKFAWQEFSPFKRYRLRNITVSLIHSLISGLYVLNFFIFNSELMFYQTLDWYQPYARHIVLMSMGYFIHDTIDISINERSRWTFELLLHHCACMIVFSCAILPKKFLLYAYWALLMEVNSIFLHMRTTLRLSKLGEKYPKIQTIISILNLSTFLIFRFGVQIWQIQWILSQGSKIHYFYYFIGFYGGLFFFVINLCLLLRLIAAENLLGSKRVKDTSKSKNGETIQLVIIEDE